MRSAERTSSVRYDSSVARATNIGDKEMAISWLNEARVATVGSNITLTGNGTPTLDGVSLAAGDRVLVKDQATASQNGIYVWATGGGTWSRATDFATGTASVTPEV